MANATNEASLPWMIDIDAFAEPTDQVAAAPGLNVGGIHIGNAQRSTGATGASAQNDYLAWDVTLAKGTWSMEIMYQKFTNQGIYSAQLDDVEFGTIDGYAASSLPNTLTTISGITVSQTKVYRFKLKMTDKNASSTGYSSAVEGLRWLRTA